MTKTHRWGYEICPGIPILFLYETKSEAQNRRHHDREYGLVVGPLKKIKKTVAPEKPKE